jgi:inner membrane protein
MASAFGHALAAIGIGRTFTLPVKSPTFWILGIACSILPDADVIGFQYGIPYESFWGHRGFSHSILFAFLLGTLLSFLFFYNKSLKQQCLIALYLFLCTLSHGILDGLTNGGLGVAFFSPFDNARYFFPFRPIQVSPIGISNFFSSWGLAVIVSELCWIACPFLIWISIQNAMKFFRNAG